MAAIFEITDATTTVNFIAPTDGFHLQEWNRSIVDFKGGGTFQDSPLAEGRRLVNVVRGNGVETITLKANNVSQDSLIRDEQNLFRLLQKATDFWTSDFQNTPVYLKVLGSRETETRYAIIVNWRIPELPNQFNAPFLQPGCLATLREFDVIIERGEWLALPPATDEAVQVSNLHPVYNIDTFEPAANLDTVSVDSASNFTTDISLGNFLGLKFDAGIRFDVVAIPQGVTIKDAKIIFIPLSTASNDDVYLKFFGEDEDDAAIFSTAVDFQGRTRTTEFLAWNKVPTFTIATAIDSPSIVPIVQEIIDRSGWASGNHLVIFVEDNGSDGTASRNSRAFDDGGSQTQLVVTWETGTERGRNITTSNEVYIANAFKIATLTHIFFNDDSAGTFTANLIGSALPYTLIPTALGLDDKLYIGISAASSSILGTFLSVVFDIVTPGDFTGVGKWEYFNGASFVGFGNGNIRDNTAPGSALSTVLTPFMESGVNSIHYIPVSDWVTTTINGVVAFWIRFDFDFSASPITSVIQQQNREVYTINHSWVDIASGQILGDIKSINRNDAQNQSNGTDEKSASNRLILGSRTPITNDVFVPFLNCTDFQNGSGIIVTVDSDTTEGDADPTTANSERSTFTATDTVQATRVTFTIDDFASPSYGGEFRLFFRGKQNTKAGTDFAKINGKITTGDGGVEFTGDQIAFEFTNDWQLLDLGKIRIPTSSLFAVFELPNEVILEIQIQAGTSGDVVYCYDVALMPVSEWAGDFVDKANTSKSILGNRSKLEVDSTKQPKVSIRGVLKQTTDEQIFSVYQPITNGAFSLQANVAQKLYFLSARYGANDEWVSEPWIAHSIQLFKNERYLAARGNR